MEIKRVLRTAILISGVLLLAIGMAACNRPASKSPTGAATATLAGGQLPTDQNMGVFEPFGTETAQANQGQPPQPPATQEPPAVTATSQQPEAQQPTEQGGGGQQPASGNFPTVTPGIPTTYTLQKGEFPFCIARRFNVNQTELLAINGLTLNSRPDVGFTLKIPQTGNHFVSQRALKAHPTTYTVKAGDTIYTIACAFGDVSPDMIGLVNGLSAPYNLSVGQTLQIP
jgi:LysM repeat protein